MAAGKDIFRQDGESEEQHVHRLNEMLLGHDWFASMRKCRARYDAAIAALESETDPSRVVSLVAEKGTALLGSIGALGIEGWKQAQLAERTAFEATFGTVE